MTTILEDVMKEIDYKTFIHIINNIPSCIFYKDTDLRYRFSSHCWEQLMSDDIVGKTDLEVRKDRENAELAMEADREILRTGKGTKYVIKSEIEGHVSYLELIKEPIFDENGIVMGIVGLINDITEKTILEQQLKELSSIDKLTQVLNRQAGIDRIQKKIQGMTGCKAIFMLDLDRFKAINDTYGHQVGDLVLMEFAAALKKSIDENDVVMRLGGDEFVIFLDQIDGEADIDQFLQVLYANIETINVPGIEKKLEVSIGVKLITEETPVDDLYAEIDDNMYKAKKHFGNHYVLS